MAKLSKELRMGIHNRFDIEVVDAKTGEVRQKARAFNIILNAFWNKLCGQDGYYNKVSTTHIHYGTGTGTPSVTDTTLFTFLGAKAVTEVSTNADYEHNVISRVCYIQLGTSDAVGANLTEVGLASGTSSNTLSTHAVLQDMNGNPISIQKTSTDVINIYATIYIHLQVPNNVVTRNSSFEILWYPDLIYKLTGKNTLSSLGLYTGANAITNTGILGTSYTESSFVWDSENKRVSVSRRLNIGEGNIGGINYLWFDQNNFKFGITHGSNSWSNYQITGESVGVGDGTTTEFKTKFHCPKNAKVYLNGVEQQNVTVNPIPVTSSLQVVCIDATKSSDNDLFYTPNFVGNNQTNVATPITFYNPFYQYQGISSVQVSHSGFRNITIKCSNDLVNWVTLLSRDDWGVTYNVPADYKNYKYWQILDASSGCYMPTFTPENSNNIIFGTPPAQGDVITIDYTTDYIPKDADHVLDVTLTLTFGEWQEE